MKTQNQLKISFSHRSVLGTSVGIVVNDNKAYIAATFVRSESGDQFCRKTARQIISGRLSSMIDRNKSYKYMTSRPLSKTVDAFELMKFFREHFKPDPQENDVAFIGATADELWGTMVAYLELSILKAGAS